MQPNALLALQNFIKQKVGVTALVAVVMSPFVGFPRLCQATKIHEINSVGFLNSSSIHEKYQTK
jgi:hypothetical protein